MVSDPEIFVLSIIRKLPFTKLGTELSGGQCNNNHSGLDLDRVTRRGCKADGLAFCTVSEIHLRFVLVGTNFVGCGFEKDERMTLLRAKTIHHIPIN